MAISSQIIHIHAEAPAKPEVGKPCNGCGVCCASEPCPLSMVLLRNKQNTCSALTWQNDTKRYICGMVTQPSKHLNWLPKQLDQIARRIFKRWIAADTNCDASVVTESL